MKAQMRRKLTGFEEQVLDALEEAGLEPHVCTAALSGSCYIKFGNEKLRSLRIGDHKGYTKYRYKWNLRFDIQEMKSCDGDGVMRFYYPCGQYLDMIRHMKNYLTKANEREMETNYVLSACV